MEAYAHKADKSKVDIGSVLTAPDAPNNADEFYFDYQNGKYGFNTDPDRGADTFHPFSSGVIKVGTVTTAGSTIDVSSYSGYSSFTTNNFLIIESNDGSATATQYSYNGEARNTFFEGTYTRPTKSYNSSTGILTVTPSIITGSGGDHGAQNYSSNAYIPCDVYLVTGDIENA